MPFYPWDHFYPTLFIAIGTKCFAISISHFLSFFPLSLLFLLDQILCSLTPSLSLFLFSFFLYLCFSQFDYLSLFLSFYLIKRQALSFFSFYTLFCFPSLLISSIFSPFLNLRISLSLSHTHTHTHTHIHTLTHT